MPLTQWSRARRRALLAAGAAISLALAFHFGMTAIYHTPFNPVKEKYNKEISSYMLPYFGQDWHLFAPDPVDKDLGVLVRAKMRKPDGSTVTTQWSDATSPGLQELYDARFWPSRESRLSSGVPTQLDSWRDTELEKIRKKNRPESAPGKEPGKEPEEEKLKDLDPPLTQNEKDNRESAVRYAQSFASACAAKLWGTGVESVQVRIVSNEFPRFSQRYARDAKGKISYYDLPWMKPIKVAP
ncbi:DUF5819 family protein [Streptomyces hiroshimensis]